MYVHCIKCWCSSVVTTCLFWIATGKWFDWPACPAHSSTVNICAAYVQHKALSCSHSFSKVLSCKRWFDYFMLPFIVDSVQTIRQRAWKREGAPKFWLNFTGLLSDETKPIMKWGGKKNGDLVPATLAHCENWSCRAASCVAVANVKILWNAWRRQKASASAPQCTSNKTKKEPYHEAPLLMHSHSCCLQRADCLCDLLSHVSACFLFTEGHGTTRGNVFVSTVSHWPGFHLDVKQKKQICCVSFKWSQQKKRHWFCWKMEV